MRALIEHLARENRAEVYGRSLLNCHARGLHSLMLSEAPGRIIRIFHATRGHELYRNFAGYEGTASIAIHPHRQNITLHRIGGEGQLLNMVYEHVEPRLADRERSRFTYSSAIIDGEVGFRRMEQAFLRRKEGHNPNMRPGDFQAMQAQELHTVAVPAGMTCTWAVYEGRPAPVYISECFSDADLEREDFSHLYQKPTEAQVDQLIEDILKDME